MPNGNESTQALKDKLNLQLPKKQKPGVNPGFGAGKIQTPGALRLSRAGRKRDESASPSGGRTLTLDEDRLRRMLHETNLLESGVDHRQNMVEGAGILGATTGGATGGVLGRAYYKAGLEHPAVRTLLDQMNPKDAGKLRFAGSRWIPGIAMGAGALAGAGLATAGVRNAFRSDTFNRTLGQRMLNADDPDTENKTQTALAGGMATGAGVGMAGQALASRLIKRNFPDIPAGKLTPKSLGKAALVGSGFGALRAMINRSIVSGGESARERLDI